jgi:hypothetical protein
LLSFGSGQAKQHFLFLTSRKNIFNHQRMWADGSLFPSLRQYSVVGGNFTTTA